MNDLSPPPVPVNSPKSGLATASMVLGILALPTCWATAIPAIITGHLSLSKIKKSFGVLGGQKAAKAGLILGYGSLVLIPLVAALAGLAAPLIVRTRDKDFYQNQCISNIRQLGIALAEYSETQGTDTNPFPSDLRQLDSMGITSNVERLLVVPSAQSGDWIYFWSADLENPNSVLLISPRIGGKSVMLKVDQSVSLVDQPEIEKALQSPNEPVRFPAPVLGK